MKLTKEQVLKNLEDIVRFGGLTMSNEFVESVRIAMEAYEQEPCEDCISRQAVIDITAETGALETQRRVMTLPPVYPKVKTEWIPIKTKPLTEKEKAEMGTESDYMYNCPFPDDGEEVEVTTYLGDVTLDVFCRDSSDGCYFEDYCDDGEVIAWRHKPEPYKESEDE